MKLSSLLQKILIPILLVSSIQTLVGTEAPPAYGFDELPAYIALDPELVLGDGPTEQVIATSSSFFESLKSSAAQMAQQLKESGIQLKNALSRKAQQITQQVKESSIQNIRIQTLRALNQVIPNFEQTMRTMKKSLESSLQHVNTIMTKLEIPEEMTLPEAERQIKYLEKAINKLEAQRDIRQRATLKLDAMTSEQIRAGIKSGKISPSDLTGKQIEDAYGIAEEVN